MAGLPNHVDTWREGFQRNEIGHTNHFGYHADGILYDYHDAFIQRDGFFNHTPVLQESNGPHHPPDPPLHQPQPVIYEDLDFPPDPRPIFPKPQTIHSAPRTPTTTKKPVAGSKAKSVQCPYRDCPQTFTCNHNRDQHIREKHTFERPNVCEICEAVGKKKTFSRPFALYRHLREVHKLHVSVGRGNRPRGTAGMVVLEGRVAKAPPTPKKGMGTKLRAAGGVGKTTNEEVEAGNCSSAPAAPALVDEDSSFPQHETVRLGLSRCKTCHAVVETGDQLLVHQHEAHCTLGHDACRCSQCLNHFYPVGQLSSDISADHRARDMVLSRPDDQQNQPQRTETQSGLLGEPAWAELDSFSFGVQDSNRHPAGVGHTYHVVGHSPSNDEADNDGFEENMRAQLEAFIRDEP